MSYDVTVWSVSPLSAVSEVLTECGFTSHESAGFYLEGKGWQITIHASPAKDEDIPDAAMALLPGIRLSIQMNLEPGSAPAAAYARLRKIAKLLSQQTRGVIEDPQEGSYDLATGVRKYSSPERGKQTRFSILQMSWWFEDDLLDPREKLYRFIGLLERYLPEALPRRYGLFEPPQFTYGETGKDHFAELLAAHRQGVVCYTTKPVWGIHFALNPKSGFVNNGRRRKYKCSALTISIDGAVLEEEHWRRHLHETWKVFSQALGPFYGDVRILRNFIGGKATYFCDATTQQHPVKSWWWRGVPAKPAQAVVIGGPYLDLWPEAIAAGSQESGLYFVSAREWSDDETIAAILKVPSTIAQPVDAQSQKIISAEEFRASLTAIRKDGTPTIPSTELAESFPFADDGQEA